MAFFGAKIVVFEGGDGCGKTTQIKLLKKFLEEKGSRVYTTREPGGSPNAEKIRKLFLSQEKLDIWTQILLCSAARREHLCYLEELQVKECFDIIIFDRFIDSTFAYQIYPYNLSPKIFIEINREMNLNIDIDCTFILDMDPEITIARRSKLSTHYDSNIELLRKVREAYLLLQNRDRSKILINSNAHAKLVHRQIARHATNAIFGYNKQEVDQESPQRKKNRRSNFRRKKNVENQGPQSQPSGKDRFF